MNRENTRILIAAEIYPPDIGGPATYAYHFAQYCVKLGYSVDVLCYSNEKKISRSDSSVRVFRINRSSFPFLHFLRYFFVLMKHVKKYFLVYAQGPVSSGFLCVLSSKFIRRPVAVKVVGDYAWEYAQNHHKTNAYLDAFQKEKTSGKVFLLRLLQRFTCRHAEMVIVPSRYLKKIVSGWGVEEERIKVIPNSFFIPISNSVHSPTRDTLLDKRVIVSAGRLVPWKGFDLLIEVFADISKEFSEIELKIFGEGPEEKRLQELVKRCGVVDRVLIEKRSHQQFLQELSEAQIFVLNTGYEGLSHTLLEVMASGVPIITTRVGGNPEMIEDGKTGLLISYNHRGELRSALRKLLTSPALREELARNALKKVREFEPEQMVHKTLHALVEMKRGFSE